MRPEPGAELENEVYERESFRGLDLSGLRTSHCTFHECDFTLARLNASEHAGSDFANSTFESANLFGARFADCRLVGATLVAATLTGLTVEAGDWSYVLLRGQTSPSSICGASTLTVASSDFRGFSVGVASALAASSVEVDGDACAGFHDHRGFFGGVLTASALKTRS